MSKMTEGELELLEHLAGQRDKRRDGRDFAWGAWMADVIDGLGGLGYIAKRGGSYEVTPAGRAALADAERKEM